MKTHKLYAGAVAGAMLGVFFTLVNLAVFMFASVAGMEYAGAVVDYREFLLQLSVGVIFGGVHDILPGSRSASKAIAFMLVFSLIPLSYVFLSFGSVWKATKFPFILLSLVAGSIVFGAFLGWFFDIGMKRTER